MESFELKGKHPVALEQVSESEIETLLSLAAKMHSSDTYTPLLERSEWEEELKSGTVNFIRNGAEIVGCLAYEQKDPSHIYISELFITPEHQGKGVAREVLSKFIVEHPEATRVDLTTHPDNPAVGLYKSLGFEVEERRENYYGDGQPRLVLVLSKPEKH
ncbi:hypothetical protein BH11PAT2_BH11PAT2_05840 [soil metagenome]